MIAILSKIVNANNLRVRVNWFYDPGFEISEWDHGFFIPVEGYLEPSSLGPVPIREIKWFQIDPIEVKVIGRLVPDKKIDHSKNVGTYLTNNSIEFTWEDGLFQIENPDYYAHESLA